MLFKNLIPLFFAVTSATTIVSMNRSLRIIDDYSGNEQKEQDTTLNESDFGWMERVVQKKYNVKNNNTTSFCLTAHYEKPEPELEAAQKNGDKKPEAQKFFIFAVHNLIAQNRHTQLDIRDLDFYVRVTKHNSAPCSIALVKPNNNYTTFDNLPTGWAYALENDQIGFQLIRIANYSDFMDRLKVALYEEAHKRRLGLIFEKQDRGYDTIP